MGAFDKEIYIGYFWTIILKMNRKILTFLCFMVFVLASFNFLALPKTIYDIGLNYGWNRVQKGNLLSVNAVGFIVAALVSGYLSERFGKKQLIIFGLVFSSLGNAAFGYLPEIKLADPFYLFFMFNFLIGVGNGILEGLTNALIIHLHPDKSSLYLNLAHAFFALGALIAPLIGGWLMSVSGWQAIFYLNAVTSFVLFISLLPQACPTFRSDQGIKLKVLLYLAKNRIFLLLSLSIALYVAAEVGLIAWLVEYLRVNPNFRLSQFESGLFLSCFWLAMLAGRFVYGWWVEKTSPTFALSVSSIGGTIIIILFLTTANVGIAALLIFLYGISLSGMYATIFSLAGDRFPQYLGVVSGSMTAWVGLGGIISPNIIGRLSDVPGVGLSVGLATCGLYLLVVLLTTLLVSKSIH